MLLTAAIAGGALSDSESDWSLDFDDDLEAHLDAAFPSEAQCTADDADRLDAPLDTPALRAVRSLAAVLG